MMIGRRRFAFQVAVGLAPMLLALTGAGLASAASGGWTISGSPSSIDEGVATAISFKATNTSGGSSVGCVQLTVPSAFDVSGVAVDSVPAGLSWTADAPSSSGTSTLVRVHGVTEVDIIKTDGQSIDFRVVVTGTGVGSYTWPAESRDHANCTSGIDSASVTVAIVAASPTPTPPPTPGPTPAPTATSTPAPTPKPAPTATPRPTPTPTAQPASPTPAQSSSTTPTPTPTAPRSDPSSSPVAGPTGLTGPSPGPNAMGWPASPGAAGFGGPGGSSAGSGTSAGQGGSTPNSGTTTDRYRVGRSQPDNGLNPSIVTSALGFGGVLEWAIPSLALTVPGLLLLLVILAQIGGAAAWLPVVRRKVGGFGFRSRGRAKVW